MSSTFSFILQLLFLFLILFSLAFRFPSVGFGSVLFKQRHHFHVYFCNVQAARNVSRRGKISGSLQAVSHQHGKRFHSRYPRKASQLLPHDHVEYLQMVDLIL